MTESESKVPRSALVAGLVILAGVALFFTVNADDEEGQDDPVEPAAAFRDVAAESGLDFRMGFLPNEQGDTFKINLYDHGCGVAVGDCNGDGFEDVYFLNQMGPNGLFVNKGDGTFENRTDEAGVALEDRISNGATFADFDNDGDQDLFVTSTRGGNVLFRNRGDGSFEDATDETGLKHVGHSQTAAFFDYDKDGFLDLLVLNTSEWTTTEFDESAKYYIGKGLGGESGGGGLNELIDASLEYNILYHNNGNGTFTDVSESSGLKGRGWASDVAIFDYDEDGWIDVYITSMFGPDQLYRNSGDGTFKDVTAESLGRTSFGAIGAKLFDYNTDGRLDLIVVDMHSDMWMGIDYQHESLQVAKQNETKRFDYFYGPNIEKHPQLMKMEMDMEGELEFRHEDVFFGNVLYENTGGGKFKEVSQQANLETFWPWGVAAGDFNNDGHEDVFMAAGMGFPFYYWPNSLLLNQGDGTFTDVADDAGVEPPVQGEYFDEKIQDRLASRSSRCAAVADFDNDGRLDVMTNNFNDRPYYFRNAFPKQNYVAFRLRGTKSNRDAVGAVVTVTSNGGKQVRLVQTAGGYLSQSTRTVHFGLGDAAEIESVEVQWPSGQVQRISALEINSLHDVVEPDSETSSAS